MDQENFFHNYCHGPVAEIIFSEETCKATSELILEHLILSNFRNIRTAKVLCFGLFQIISSDNIEKKFPIKGEKIKPNYDELIQLLRSVSRKLD